MITNGGESAEVRRCLVLSIIIASFLVHTIAVYAHEIRPAIVTVTVNADQRYEIELRANLEALIAEIGTKHSDTDQSPHANLYDELRALSADELQARFTAFAPRWLEGVDLRFDNNRMKLRISSIAIPPPGDLALARISTVRFFGKIPPNSKFLTWSYAAQFGNNVLRVKRPDADKTITSWLKDGASSKPVPLRGKTIKNAWNVLWDYAVIGFEHIVPKGLDHILFVLGLYLLSLQISPLLWQVTAFTIAHSITLALGLYGIVQISPSIVEPLIALSIVYVAVENIMTSRLNPWRPVVVFGFGLLHGLGFAGILREIGLSRPDFVLGLIGFNVGVEFGQLTVIALAWMTTGLWFGNRPWYRQRIVLPASAAIAMIGLYWSVERVLLA